MQARSALFDLYGDYLRPRGGRAPVAALVRLLAPLGIAAPAVRTAVSRMVRQGWLHPLRLSSGPGYLLTPKASRRLDDASARIYRTGRLTWNGSFDLLVVEPPISRPERQRLAATLGFLGYGSLDATTWVAPRPAEDVEQILTESSVRFERFAAAHTGGLAGATALVRRAWDLPELAAEYERFIHDARELVDGAPHDDGAAYVARFTLVHRWRTFLFRDPQLPQVLLPERWPGTTAAAFFDHHATRLRPAADRFVDRCLTDAQRPVPRPPVPA
jgi:phenylacetic acid degradation operon negative regulatory protein